LTNSAGVHKLAIAETVLGFMLADAKELPMHLRNQRLRRWEHLPHAELRGQTVAILGLGRVGLEIARLCAALDMRVIGTKRTLPREPLPWVAEVFPPETQDECVAQADYVVIAATLTPQTRGMVNASTFRAMRPATVLINIARGAIVDEATLLEALRARRIRTAYLDVFAVEPLPPDSPFFALPNVVITPHNSAWSQQVVDQVCSIFLDNFRRYFVGEPLHNIVDKQALMALRR
jgi:phosphoglycerate dehydrogenase-like enzyme